MAPDLSHPVPTHEPPPGWVRPGLTAIIILAAVSLAASCDETKPSPTVTNITVSLPATVPIGQTAQASAMATLSDGSTRSIATGWQSDNPPVATVTDSGLVTGVSNGRATIFVIDDGRQGQLNIRVLPHYEGHWVGTAQVTSCTPFPSASYAVPFCVGFDSGTILPVEVTMARTDEVLTGQFFGAGLLFDQFVIPIGGDGSMFATGTNVTPPIQTETTWALDSPGIGELTGTTQWVRRGSSGLVGYAIIEGVVTLSKQ